MKSSLGSIFYPLVEVINANSIQTHLMCLVSCVLMSTDIMKQVGPNNG